MLNNIYLLRFVSISTSIRIFSRGYNFCHNTFFSFLQLRVINHTEQILAYTCTSGSNGFSMHTIQSTFVVCPYKSFQVLLSPFYIILALPHNKIRPTSKYGFTFD